MFAGWLGIDKNDVIKVAKVDFTRPDDVKVDNTSRDIRRRLRTNFSASQVEQMEESFTQAHYPDVTTREKLATLLRVSEAKIQVISISIT